jgi:hypothetical protein
VSEQQAAPPQYSPDGRWWWNGQEWVPVAAQKQGRSTVKIVLAVVAGLVALLVVAALVLGTLVAPIGTQHDSSEVEGYCEIFPEDC